MQQALPSESTAPICHKPLFPQPYYTNSDAKKRGNPSFSLASNGLIKVYTACIFIPVCIKYICCRKVTKKKRQMLMFFKIFALKRLFVTITCQIEDVTPFRMCAKISCFRSVRTFVFCTFVSTRKLPAPIN